ncbi:MAG TPA: hypothetical protein VHO25_24870 [Polyangiaceae bacterium]|nr:hypothetical protein [Polyangiaceae bacterium]
MIATPIAVRSLSVTKLDRGSRGVVSHGYMSGQPAFLIIQARYSHHQI